MIFMVYSLCPISSSFQSLWYIQFTYQTKLLFVGAIKFIFLGVHDICFIFCYFRADVIVIIISLISAIVNIYHITWAVILPLKLIR